MNPAPQQPRSRMRIVATILAMLLAAFAFGYVIGRVIAHFSN